MDIIPSAGMMLSTMLLMGLFGLAVFAFWLWVLIDCITKEPNVGNDKIVWILVIVLLHTLGALIYLIARRPMRIQTYGQ